MDLSIDERISRAQKRLSEDPLLLTKIRNTNYQELKKGVYTRG
ncbi:MAG: hypothetical protein AB1665_07665 [Candidatus Thermoplasmatota archaeon]